MSPEQVAAAVRMELSGYWSLAVRRPWWWLADWVVDLGLFTMARAAVALDENRLITKSEALLSLGELGVPPLLAAEIARRRAGGHVWVGPIRRVIRARTARRIVAAHLATRR